MNEKFHLTVDSREGRVFEGEVISISSFNEEGKFDVLSKHANFISLIQNKLIVRDLSGKEIDIPVHNALLRVREDKAEVYLGIETIFTSKRESEVSQKDG